MVGEDDGAGAPPLPASTSAPGLEARDAGAGGARRPRRASSRPTSVHLHNVMNPAVLEWAAARPGRAPDRAGPPLLLPDARASGRSPARCAGAPMIARGLRLLLRGPGLLPRGPRAHGAAPPRGPASCRSPCSRATCARSSSRRACRRGACTSCRPSSIGLDPGRRAERAAVRALRGPARGGEGRARRGRGVAPLGRRPAARAGGDGAAPRGARRRRRAGARGRRSRCSAGSSATGSPGSIVARGRSCLPSRWQEPFGIVGLEALSFGVPVVAWESGRRRGVAPGPGARALGRRRGAGASARRRREPPRHAPAALRARRGDRPAAGDLRSTRSRTTS